MKAKADAVAIIGAPDRPASFAKESLPTKATPLNAHPAPTAIILTPLHVTKHTDPSFGAFARSPGALRCASPMPRAICLALRHTKCWRHHCAQDTWKPWSCEGIRRFCFDFKTKRLFDGCGLRVFIVCAVAWEILGFLVRSRYCSLNADFGTFGELLLCHFAQALRSFSSLVCSMANCIEVGLHLCGFRRDALGCNLGSFVLGFLHFQCDCFLLNFVELFLQLAHASKFFLMRDTMLILLGRLLELAVVDRLLLQGVCTFWAEEANSAHTRAALADSIRSLACWRTLGTNVARQTSPAGITFADACTTAAMSRAIVHTCLGDVPIVK
jgi:hypothetical protein